MRYAKTDRLWRRCQARLEDSRCRLEGARGGTVIAASLKQTIRRAGPKHTRRSRCGAALAAMLTRTVMISSSRGASMKQGAARSAYGYVDAAAHLIERVPAVTLNAKARVISAPETLPTSRSRASSSNSLKTHRRYEARRRIECRGVAAACGRIARPADYAIGPVAPPPGVQLGPCVARMGQHQWSFVM